MTKSEKENFIRAKALECVSGRTERIAWTHHAVGKLITERLNRSDVELALCNAEVVEDYPWLHRPLPDCLVLERLASGEPIHTVVALDKGNDRIIVVTVYRPSEEEWLDDWKTRRQ